MEFWNWFLDYGVAVVSAAVAITSMVLAGIALKKSSTANEYARHADSRETEVNHVSFDYTANFEKSTLTLFNTQPGKTLGLRGTVTVDDSTVAISEEDMDEQGRIHLSFPSLRQGYRAHQRALRATANAPTTTVPFIPTDFYMVSWDLVWHSPKRNPGQSRTDAQYCYFPDE